MTLNLFADHFQNPPAADLITLFEHARMSDRDHQGKTMKPLKIYLDTSVISFLFAEDTPDLRRITERFFTRFVNQGYFETYISEVVLQEIEKTQNLMRRDQLLSVITTYGFSILPLNEEIIRMAGVYIKCGTIPRSKLDDARHVAVATYHQMDILLSWNFRHLANVRKESAIHRVNEAEGYRYPLRLTNPMEVMYDEKEND
jgi:predicted nucleic acid-binding protein